jgi:hypothetical protein
MVSRGLLVMSALRFRGHCVAQKSGMRSSRGRGRRSGKTGHIGGKGAVIVTIQVSGFLNNHKGYKTRYAYHSEWAPGRRGVLDVLVCCWRRWMSSLWWGSGIPPTSRASGQPPLQEDWKYLLALGVLPHFISTDLIFSVVGG